MLKFLYSSVILSSVFLTTLVSPFLSSSALAGSTSNLKGAGAKLIVYNVNYNGRKFIGQVLNQSGKSLKFLKLNYEIVDEQGQLVDVGTTYITEDTLGRSQNGTFWGISRQVGTSVIITSAEWVD